MTVTEERPVESPAVAIPAQAQATSAAARKAMIDSQLRPSGVNEPWILDAMGTIPREDFVPAEMKEAAYIDRAIPLGNGRMLGAPLVQGRLLAEARPTQSDKALLVGDGNGYLAALLRPLVGSLATIDPADAARPGAADGENDYSLLIIDGAVEVLPEAVADRLAEGGRIVTGQVLRGVTRIAVGRKAVGDVTLLPLTEIGIPVLAEFAAPKRWEF